MVDWLINSWTATFSILKQERQTKRLADGSPKARLLTRLMISGGWSPNKQELIIQTDEPTYLKTKRMRRQMETGTLM